MHLKHRNKIRRVPLIFVGLHSLADISVQPPSFYWFECQTRTQVVCDNQHTFVAPLTSTCKSRTGKLELTAWLAYWDTDVCRVCNVVTM